MVRAWRAARGCVLTKDRARTGRSQKIVPGLEPFNHVSSVKPGPERSEGPASSIGSMCKREPERSEGAPSPKIGRELGAHKRSCPDLNRLTMSAALSPDLSEVRVQRRASVQCVSVNPNEVRVRPHQRSGANLKRRASVQCVSVNPNEVRVRGQSSISAQISSA